MTPPPPESPAPFSLDRSGVAALRDETVAHAKQAATAEVQALLDVAVVTKDADGMKVMVVPRNAIVALPDPGDEESRNRIAGQLRDRIDHPSWAAVFVSKGQTVAVLGPDELVSSLRATMADEVRAEVLAEARQVAAETASHALGAAAASPPAPDAPFGGDPA